MLKKYFTQQTKERSQVKQLSYELIYVDENGNRKSKDMKSWVAPKPGDLIVADENVFKVKHIIFHCPTGDMVVVAFYSTDLDGV